MILDNKFLKGGHGLLDEKFIVTSYNGQTYLRRKPKSIRMAAGMVEQGERISAAAALWKAMKAVGLDRAWQMAAEGYGLTAYNMVVKHCQKAFDGQGFISDFEKLKLTCLHDALPILTIWFWCITAGSGLISPGIHPRGRIPRCMKRICSLSHV